ncbi:nucleoside hydrolase [Trinickia mobilis]|uniref:nucleoside hydrolase n=1 Tax=Trinickia mobilis TaxID=2816356 RepID=UPI001A8FCD97|nr:nucleoside hydrolase [Trinickia mobilis]
MLTTSNVSGPPERIIIDCDPGHDDAIAILMALAMPEALDVLGVTTVAGNASAGFTSENASIICALGRRPNVPVRRGCSRPLVRRFVDATAFHGESGLDGLPERSALASSLPAESAQHAVDFLIQTLTTASEPVTLVCLAPLTNIAMALIKAPEVAGKIKEVVFMGGARRAGGNVSPCATFNVLCDPHAAHVVIDSGLSLTVISLDATSQVIISEQVLEEMGRLKSDVARMGHRLLTYFNRRRMDVYGYSADKTTLNDPCVIAYLLDRTVFRGKPANVAVSIDSELTLGMTVVDLDRRSGRNVNALWIDEVDAPAVLRSMIDAFGRYEVRAIDT